MESTFQIGCVQCPDVSANTMALDATGRFVVLSGRKNITLIDLDGDPTGFTSSDGKLELPVQSTTRTVRNPPIIKKFTRSSKYEPTASHFNRFTTDLIALTNYQVAEVFSVQEINPSKPKLVLRGHSRAIVDVEWSQFDPHVLGTSGADCITNLWDIRDYRRPSASLTSVSSGTQVRFCKTSHNLIATSHEIDVRIWDIRQPNLPLYYIAAHLQKINGADWNPGQSNCDQKQLITCSQDSTIKLWDLTSNKVKLGSNVQIRAPAWRIRHTPISANAILTSTLPQLKLRNECTALKLWTLKPSRYEQRKLELMACLVGHTDVIVDFDWRARSASSDCELVSWSKDQTLRIWRIDQQFIEMNVDNQKITEYNQKMTDYSQKKTDHSQSQSQTSGPGIDLKDDPISLSVQRDHSVPFPASTGARFCGNLLICFGRPIISTSNESSTETANWSIETPRSMAQLSAQLDNMRRQGAYNLSHISISYFYYGAELQNRATKNSTPREKSNPKHKSLQSHYVMSKSYKCGPVLLYDVSSLLDGISKDLAKNYVFDKDVIKMCKRNAEVAASFDRKDLVQIWLLAELSSEGVLHSYLPNRGEDNATSIYNHFSDFGDRPWTMHPFGGKLIQSLIDHYLINCHDVQTAAMLVWTFSSPRLGHSKNRNNLASSSNKVDQLSASSASQRIVLGDGLPGTKEPSYGDTVSDEWNFVNGQETHLYSNSWSNCTIQEQLSDTAHNGDAKYDGTSNQDAVECFPKINILSAEKSLQNDLIMHIYAEVLYKMNLLNQRAMVLKNICSNSAYSEIFGNLQVSNEVIEDRLSNLFIQCHNGDCKRSCKSVQCLNCKKFSLYCSICRLPVRGPSSICLKCLHGGHVNHFNAWFSKFDFCPTGCGCNCLD